MERCDNYTALEAAYLFALETYAALLYQEFISTARAIAQVLVSMSIRFTERKMH
jgi:hypothetical protein